MPHDWRPLSNVISLVYGTVDSSPYVVIIGYWLDMEIYVRVLMRSNIARRQEHNITYAPERVHIFPYPTNNLLITYALLSQKALWHLL